MSPISWNILLLKRWQTGIGWCRHYRWIELLRNWKLWGQKRGWKGDFWGKLMLQKFRQFKVQVLGTFVQFLISCKSVTSCRFKLMGNCFTSNGKFWFLNLKRKTSKFRTFHDFQPKLFSFWLFFSWPKSWKLHPAVGTTVKLDKLDSMSFWREIPISFLRKSYYDFNAAITKL